jgi:hypothetical protein
MSLRVGRTLNRGLRWNLNWSRSRRGAFGVLYPRKLRLRLGSSSISPHNRSRTNAEYGAEQRPPRRPQKEYEDQRKHQERFSKPRLGGAFMVDIEQHRN